MRVFSGVLSGDHLVTQWSLQGNRIDCKTVRFYCRKHSRLNTMVNATPFPRLWGRFEHSLDDKGRVIVPLRVREPLGAEFVLTMGPEHHIRVYPMAVWEALGIELTTGGLEMELNPDRVRLQRMFGNCEYTSTDPQNRLSIPRHLRDWAKLEDGDYAVIIGNGTRLEIWNRTRWREYAEKSFVSEQEIGAVAARLAGSAAQTQSIAEQVPAATA